MPFIGCIRSSTRATSTEHSLNRDKASSAEVVPSTCTEGTARCPRAQVMKSSSGSTIKMV